MNKITLKVADRQARMSGKILYCGDGTLKGAARYLQGILKYLGHRVHYVPSETLLTEKHLKWDFDLIVLSDYPASRIERRLQKKIIKKIEQGASFLMIGGYGCFHGKDGFYQNSDLVEVLPVHCESKDDRVHVPQGIVMVRKVLEFAADLDFSKSPVFVGYNRVHIKQESQVILTLKPLVIQFPKITFSKEEYPLLIFGKYGLGKTAAFTTDLAPHWCGGLVDWGDSRIIISGLHYNNKAAGANNKAAGALELGTQYIRFVQCLVESLI